MGDAGALEATNGGKGGEKRVVKRVPSLSQGGKKNLVGELRGWLARGGGGGKLDTEV